MICRLCGGSDLFFFFAGGGNQEFKYYRCQDCKLVNYDLSTGHDQSKYSATYISPRDNTAKPNKDQTDSYRYLSKFARQPGRMLDIGCYNAKILYLAKQDGWDVQGLDLSPELAAQVKRDVDIDITVQDFLEYEPTEKFDVVILRHVLEHLIDPLQTMSKIKLLLNDGGLCLIEIPNIDGHSKKVRRALTRMGIRKRKPTPPGEKPGHVNEYCRYSFNCLAKKTGFEVVDWRTYSSDPLTNFLYNHLKIGNKARALVRSV
ncbi:MAG TPA: class I SAM-dependent methyltransferase [Gammaproteobacteria bacterium]